MAESYFPFDSKFIGLSEAGMPKGDRDGSAADFAKYDADRYTNGVNVFENPNALLVVAGSGMTVSIQAGVAYIQGRRYEVDAAGKTLTLPAGNSQPRIDRIVVTMDDHEALRSCVGTVKAGTPAASPVAPALIRTIDALGETFQISLMRILVPANATSISQCTLIDERADTSVCGWSLSRRTPQPPMPSEAVLHSEIGVAGGPAAYNHTHTAAQLPTLSSAIDQSGVNIGANQAAVKAAYDRGSLGVTNAATADAKAVTAQTKANAVDASNTPIILAGAGPNFTGALPADYTTKPFKVRFPADATNAQINGVNVYTGTSKQAKVIAGQVSGVFYYGTSFFVVGSGGGLDTPATIVAGDTFFYSAHDLLWIYASSGYGPVKSIPFKTAGVYRLTWNFWTGNGTIVRSKLVKNSSVDVTSSESTTTNMAYSAQSPAIKTIDVTVAANDVISLWLRADNGGNYAYSNSFKISILWAELATEFAKLV